MDPNQRKQIEFPPNFNFKKYEDYGVDISLLTYTLRQTPTERAENNKARILIMEEAKKCRKKKLHADS